jgi:hypothetical protein
MRIAVITDNLKTVSEYFERAKFYLVFTLENGKITGQELRLKSNDGDFAGKERGVVPNDLHYIGLHSEVKNTNMMGTIIDCDVLLARGMDKAIYDGLKIRSIHPIITDIQDVQTAVDAYLNGDIIDHPEYLY